jgi:hypothetical protein
MWRSFFKAIEDIFTTVSTTMGTVQKGLDIGNDYVSNAHKEMTRGFAKQAILNTATQHAAIQAALEADPKLATIFADLEAEWDDPNWKLTANSKPLMPTKTKK